jgi:phage replisome organizer N-terminal domain protein|nr:MAG TPA: DnaD like replication protein [Caudoviricetes sp.]
MSDNKKYYYLKLRDNFFDNDDIAILESMPDGILYSNILLKLYLRSLKNNGKLMFNDRIPYNAQMLSTITRQPIAVVEKAVGIFKEMGLIEVLDNGAIYMLDIQNFIGSSNTEADRKREYRRKIALEKGQKLLGHLSGQMSDEQAPEIEIEIENRDIKENRDIEEIDSAKDNYHAAIAGYYQSRIGVLDGKQFEQLIDYIKFDHMEYELVKLAIDKAADNSKRNFGYVNSILKNWAQNGIKTTVQQEEEQSNFNKSKGFTNSRGNQSEQEAKTEWGF